MNAMTEALVVAGVKLPVVKKRIWQWLKDNGPHSTLDLASALNVSQTNISAEITVMVRRKMLRKIERKNHELKALPNHYEALGRVYELLPEPKDKGKAKVRVSDTPPSEVVGIVHDVPKFSPEKLLQDCTLAELREVQKFLGRLFK